MTEHEQARTPEDITRLFVERANAKDAAGVAALYEPDAVMAFPPGQETRGRDAIRKFWEQAFPGIDREFQQETPGPTLTAGDLALTTTPPQDGGGVRVQVVRRQTDGSWLRVLDQPELGR
ncbi:SgcJ/EcaC family oxidoreductase [Nakamurella sp. YIM 132087]|uniref:SgcJ/EcaC family oxidoreductase n=1 Tax=Nakamurella alba TaxID=2665158 RepID=A0A7K1FT88_9ACTN|nr:SgcJ/EcaC family oxidoreductase [Nakamurella alba]MTD17348.1 SgcJ/EcaC family oxidoreductase [Nakamurella alba]